MTLGLSVKRRAVQDVARTAKYLSHESLELAHRFIDAFEETIRSLAEMPKGVPCEFDNPRYRNLHSWPVNGFPNHLIFYRLTGKRIEIVRVLHGARDFGKLFG